MAVANTAAFFRVEGTIVRAGTLSTCAYLAANRPGLGERMLRLGQVALTAPVYGLLGQNDRSLVNRLAYLPLRHMGQDRVAELAEEYFDVVLRERLLEQGLELLRMCRRQGHRVVLISENLAPVVDLLARHLTGIDDYVCNHLEIRDARATGRLLEPVVGGHDSGPWASRYAAEHNLDLSHSVAYGGHGPDLLLLASVGHPCAVNPDLTLRRAARDADWPIVEYRA